MSSTTLSAARSSSAVRWLAGGLIASVVMAMWQMILEAVLPNGAGFWAPPVYIAATLLRGLQDVGQPVPFGLLGVIVGMMGHMMNSVIFGLIFALLIAPRVRGLSGQLTAGVAYGVVIFVLMWVVVVPIVDPVMRHLNGFVFFLAHLMWGAALGWINARVSSRS